MEVVNLKSLHPNTKTIVSEDLNAFYVYIGRYNKYYKLRQSPLYNPYKVTLENNRDTVIELYRKYLNSEVRLGLQGEYNEAFEALKHLAKRADKFYLVCWCYPEPCHGDVIIRAIKWLQSKHGNLLV